MRVNPFIFDRPLDPARAVARPAELEALLRYAAGGQNVRLSAPRRFGKTTLLTALADAALNAHEMVPVYVDFSRVTTLDDVVARITTAYRERLKPGVWRGVRARLSASIQASVPGVGAASVGLGPGRASTGLAELHEVLELPRAVHDRTGNRVLVIFDEFQDLLVVADTLDGVLRSHLQHQLDSASYVFAGSQPSLLGALFGDRRRPLFDQARALDLAPLPAIDLEVAIGDVLDGHGREDLSAHVSRIVTVSQGHPQRAMLLAHMLFEQPPEADDPAGAAITAAVTEASDGLEQAWRALTGPQRRVLAAVAGGHQRLHTVAALERTGLGKGAQAAARDALVSASHLDMQSGRATFVDPLMALWIPR